MITNSDITIYNRISGDSTHYDTWIRTVLHGVHVHVDHKTAVTDNGLKSAEVYKIRIPADIPEAGQYLPPDQFACCGGYGYWTIQNDDQIVLGECQIEIEKPADLKAVFQKHRMAGKKDFRITTPRGSVFTVTGKDGSVTAKLEWAPGFAQKKAEGFSRAQAFVDSECLRYMNPLTPRRTGMLIKSGTLGTVIGSGSIEYLAPYARRQYYEHKTKARWFETMKASHKDAIREGAEKLAGQ